MLSKQAVYSFYLNLFQTQISVSSFFAMCRMYDIRHEDLQRNFPNHVLCIYLGPLRYGKLYFKTSRKTAGHRSDLSSVF